MANRQQYDFEVGTAQNNRKLWKHALIAQSSMHKYSNVRAVKLTTKCELS